LAQKNPPLHPKAPVMIREVMQRLTKCKSHQLQVPTTGTTVVSPGVWGKTW
jgi:hypothetical protein